MSKTSQQSRTALQVAYQTVMQLGYSHAQLEKDHQLSLKKLRAIREGKQGRVQTDRYYLKKFVGIIDAEYRHRLANGGYAAADVLKCMREILLLTL